jgi:HEAT repeats
MQDTNNRFYAMLTTRFWGVTTGVLCALLLQNCQSQLSALEEESLAEAPLQSGCQPPASEALTQPLGYPLSPTKATHQSKVPPTAFARTSPSTGILPTASTAPSRNSLTQDSCRPFMASTGELVHFQQVDSQSQAVVQGQDRSYAPQRTLSVVSSCDIGTQLSWLQSQDSRTSRAHIHILNTSQASYSPCVYLGRAGLWGGVPSDEEEDSKPPARRKSPSPEDELVKCPKKACHGERREQACIRRDTLNILLEMAGSEPDKASNFLEVLLAAVKDRNCRQQALRALGRVAQASPDRVSECLPSLRAAARNEDKEVRLTVLKTLGEVEWKHYFGDVGLVPDLPSDMVTILDGPCPFWPDQLVKDTHLLVLIPATVGGVPFTLNGLGELIQHPSHGGHRTEYRYYGEQTKAQMGEESPLRSYWVLMTRDVLPGSRRKVYADQKAIVAGYAKRKILPYALPSVLEAATAILMHHAREGERLFGDDPWTYTRCQEVVNSCPVVIGGFSSGGLIVSCYDVCHRNRSGVSCLRKF